jgi:hypothetical protein
MRAVVLMRGPWSEGDVSIATNSAILAARVSAPVLTFPHAHDDDDALASIAAPLLATLVPGLGA